jgi:hypothetical protein
MIRITVVQAWDILYLEAIKKFLYFLHFCHLIIVVAVLFLYLCLLLAESLSG